MAKAVVPENVKVTLDDSDFFDNKRQQPPQADWFPHALFLTCDGQTKTCPIGKSIPEVVTADSKGINADWSAAGKALSDYKITNKTTKRTFWRLHVRHAQTALRQSGKAAMK